MKNKIFISILFIAIVGLSSCTKQSISLENEEFIGYWYSEYNQLYIGEDGSGTFQRQKGALSTWIDGKVKVNDKFVIFSAGVVSKKLKIDERPSLNTINNVYEMTLKGEKYYSY